MLKYEYQKMNEQIVPDPGLNAVVLDKVTPKRSAYLRPVVAVALVLVVAMLAMPTMAAYVPEISELMYQVSPEMAARFTPIQESCTKNGIRMEVVSTSIHGATAEICVSFEDVKGERLTPQSMAEMFHTQFLGREAALSGTWGGVVSEADFDEETGKLIMVVERNFSFYSEKEGRYLTVEELFGNKITLSVDRLYEFAEQSPAQIPVKLTESEVQTVFVERGQPTDHPVEVPFDGFGTASSITGDPWLMQEEYDLLTPGDAAYEVTEELSVMGMRYIDGRIHIQTRLRPEDEDMMDTYSIWFEDAAGNVVNWTNRNTFTIDDGNTWGEYEEAIFDISEEELDDLTLMCQVSKRQVIEGPWRVTFPITESDYVGERDDGVPQTEALGDHRGE